MFNKIINPKTGRKVNVNGKIGKSILQNYLQQLGGAAKDTSDIDLKTLLKKNCDIVTIYYQEGVTKDNGHVYIQCGDTIAKFKSFDLVSNELKTQSVSMDNLYLDLKTLSLDKKKYSVTALSKNIGLRIGWKQGIKIKGKNCAS